MQFIKNLYYQAKDWLKRVLFKILIDNFVARFARLPFISTSVPAVTAGYLTLREIKGDELKIFLDYAGVHDFITYALIIGTIFIGICKSLADTYLFSRQNSYIKALNEFVVMAANIVHVKSKRFKDAAANIGKSDDLFLYITHPKDQISAILGEVRHFIRHTFDIKSEDHLRITILEESLDSGEWIYSFDTQDSWTQTPAATLLDGPSAAKDCLSTGEPRFHPDKQLAAARGEYLTSERDRRFGNGSVYCYPVEVAIDGHTQRFVITIITYGNNSLCGSYNDRDSNLVGVLLKEICRRLELELTLRSIKSWKLSASPEEQND